MPLVSSPRTRKADVLEELEYVACEVICVSCYMSYFKRWIHKILGWNRVFYYWCHCIVLRQSSFSPTHWSWWNVTYYKFGKIWPCSNLQLVFAKNSIASLGQGKNVASTRPFARIAIVTISVSKSGLVWNPKSEPSWLTLPRSNDWIDAGAYRVYYLDFRWGVDRNCSIFALLCNSNPNRAFMTKGKNM